MVGPRLWSGGFISHAICTCTRSRPPCSSAGPLRHFAHLAPIRYGQRSGQNVNSTDKRDSSRFSASREGGATRPKPFRSGSQDERHRSKDAWNTRTSFDLQTTGRRRKKQVNTRDASFSDPLSHAAAYEDLPDSVVHFAEAIEAKDFRRAAACYDRAAEHLPGSKLVSSYTILLARTAISARDNGQILAQIEEAASIVRADSIRSLVPPSDPVYKRLFAVYRELHLWDEGESLWHWMTRQEEQILFLSTYAAAIEFFGRAGKPASFIQSIFVDAITSNQGAFLQYHFSPNCPLQNANIRNLSHVTSETQVLLEKVITASLLTGDVTNAYLLLDTSLRVFGQMTERTVDAVLHNLQSLKQRYLVLRVALRGGTCPKPSTMQTFMYSLTRAPGKRDIGLNDYIARKDRELGAALKLVVCCYDANGQFDERLIASALLPVQDVVLRLAQIGDIAAAHQLADSTEQLVDAVYPLLTPPAAHLHNALLGIGSYANHPTLINRNLERLLDRGGKPNMTTCRALVVGSGSSSSIQTLKDAWHELELMAKARNAAIGALEFDALVFAVNGVRQPQAVDFLQTTADEHKYAIAEGVIAKLQNLCSSVNAHSADSSSDEPLSMESKADDTRLEIEQLCSTLITMQNILRSIVNDPEYKLDHDSLGMSLSSPLPPSPLPVESAKSYKPEDLPAPLPIYYRIYNLLCIEPSSDASISSTTPTFSQLEHHPILKQRFLDWVSMTNLLALHHRQMWQTAASSEPVSIADEDTGLVVSSDEESHAAGNGVLSVGSVVLGTSSSDSAAAGLGDGNADGETVGRTRWSRDEEFLLADLADCEDENEMFEDLMMIACSVRGISR